MLNLVPALFTRRAGHALRSAGDVRRLAVAKNGRFQTDLTKFQPTCYRLFSSVNHKSEESAHVIDGKQIADDILEDVEAQVRELQRRHGADNGTPTLAVVLVGDRPDSEKYVSMKDKAAKRVGFRSIKTHVPSDCSQADLLETVQQLNSRDDIDGLMVQLPLPAHLDQTEILKAIDESKDVDGFHPQNTGTLARMGEDLRFCKKSFVPLETRNFACTPLGVLVILEKTGVDLNGKHVVVLGRSNIVGLPVALMCLHKNATITIAHSRTKNLAQVCRSGDVLIAAVGKAEFVKGDWVKPGATVIDVGINFKKDPSRKSGLRMCGDVDYEEASKVAGAITPVPGGVGPLTVAMLMANTLNNAKFNLQQNVSTDAESDSPELLRKTSSSSY